MNIRCHLIDEDGNLIGVEIPEELLINLVRSLRDEGQEIVATNKGTYYIDGIIIPAKGTKHNIAILPNIYDNECITNN